MRFSKSWRRLLPILALAAAMTWLLWPQPRPVDVAIVDRGPLLLSFEAEGRTRVRDRFVLSAPVAATARRLALQPGDAVRAGQVLVVLDPLASTPLDPRSRTEAKARLAAAKAQALAARAVEAASRSAADHAKADAERAMRLQQRGLLAASEAEHLADTARQTARAVDSARYQTAAAEHAVELAAAVLDSGRVAATPLTLRAPVDGVLLRRHFESARPVAVGEALLEVGDLGSLEVEVDVLSADAVRLSRGMRVDLSGWGEDEPLRGQVLRVEPGGFSKISALGIEEQRVWVRVGLDSPRERWRRLGDGFRVTARFRLKECKDCLRLPASALFRQGEGWAVFRLERGRARLRPVRVGLQGEGRAEISAGLAVGDRVILHPERELVDNARVRPRDQPK